MKRSLFLLSAAAAAIGSLTVRAQGSPIDDLLEEYVATVVAREKPASWPSAALQAQAICTRTYYAAKQLRMPNAEGFVSPLPSPNAIGASNVPSSVQAAVAVTKGQVLSFGPTIAQIAYSACCGGRTKSSQDAWGTPYLLW